MFYVGLSLLFELKLLLIFRLDSLTNPQGFYGYKRCLGKMRVCKIVVIPEF